MKNFAFAALMMAIAASMGSAQLVQNTSFASLTVDDDVINVVTNPAGFPTPIAASLFTDSPFSVNARCEPESPFLLAFSGSTLTNTIAENAFSLNSLQVDLADVGPAGYGEQIAINGYETPSPFTYTDGGGFFNLTTIVPACLLMSGGALNCQTAPSFQISLQAITPSVTAPGNFIATGTVRNTFTNGYQEYNFGSSTPNDEFGTFVFKNGFVFNYWGTNYTQAYVSENGYVQFGSTANLSIFSGGSFSAVNGAGPRIMSFFSDLDPEISSTSPRIYAQQFIDSQGVTKVKFVHERIAEYMGQTGGHGGEIVIDQNGGIAVYVGGYNAAPSIDCIMGISRGNNTQSALYGGTYGRDLSMLHANGPTALGLNMPGCERFDHGNGSTPVNGLDLVAYNQFPTNPAAVGSGITFLPDPSLASPGGYIIQ